MKIKLAACTIMAVLICMACSSVFGADEWTMFRHDKERTGLGINGNNGVLGTFRPTPTWVFPAPESTMYQLDNGDAAFSIKSGIWHNAPLNAVGAYEIEDAYEYLWTETADTATATAEWKFTFNGPEYVMNGSSARYTVYVWVPSPGPTEALAHCKDARYTVEVFDSGGTRTYNGNFRLDQTSGGTWQYLPDSPTLLVNKTDTVIVSLSNRTEEKDDSGAIVQSQVLADAVMLKADAGMVFASPAAATTLPLVASASTERVNTIRASQYGNAIVGTVYGIGAEVDSGIASSLVDDRGMMKWRYPASNKDWIAGGISSSPAITTAIITPNANEKVVVGGIDGTVYMLNMDTGALEWKGPGYFADSVTRTGNWTAYAAGGIRGAECWIADVEKSPNSATATAQWDFTLEASSSDRYYDVYAWIPPSGSNTFVPDARYTDLKSTVANATVQVYQGGGGYWALVCKGLNVPSGQTDVSVKLSNVTDTDATYKVVADDMKLVPADVQSFDFSSPVVDSSGYIYVGSAGSAGRIMKLSPSKQEPVWIFPSTDSNPIGSIHASPAISRDGSKVYVGSSDGHIYALSADTGVQMWAYPDPNGSGSTLALPQISSTTAVTDVFGGTTIYFSTGAANPGGTTGLEGKVYAIRDDGASASPIWVYPSATQLGAFVYSSPLLIERVKGDSKLQVIAGSTSGSLYAVDAATGVDDPLYKPVSLYGLIQSSPAGTYVNFPNYNDRKTIGNRSAADAPMAFIGTGSRIMGVDLSLSSVNPAPKDWWWDLLGNAVSSPAVTRNRIYIGDTGGYTWAFSTGVPGGSAAEGWNSELGSMPETSGSDPSAGGRDAEPEVDVWTKSEWRQFREDFLEKAERSDDSADWFSSSDFRRVVRGGKVKRTGPIQMEWGEDLVIVVWNLIDPNRKDADPDKWIRRYSSADGTNTQSAGWTHNYQGKVEITIKSHAPGAASASEERITISGRQVDCFNDKDDAPGALPSNPAPSGGGNNGFSCFYAFTEYTLDGSSSGKAQTPGQMFTITAREIPVSPNASSLDIPVPDDPTDTVTKPAARTPQEFAINNPLGMVFYNAAYSSTKSSSPVSWIGMDSTGLATNRTITDANVNGNLVAPPVIWGGYTPHNRLSETREIAVADRSLLSTSGRKVSKFRMERHDMRWTGGIPQVINYLPWERYPSNSAANLPNSSEDYPDIDLRRIRVRMEANGADPTQNAVELRQGLITSVPLPSATWSLIGAGGLTALNPIGMAVQVPQFQPPNMPADPNDPTKLASSGYTSYVYAYVDSNNNAQMDRPAGLGIGQLISSAQTGSRAEAFRMLQVQVHVPADYRAQIEQSRINLGEVPHGFGYTSAGGVPQIFAPKLAYDPTYGVLAPYLSMSGAQPIGFGEWFKPLTVRNTGNVNLMKVGMLRTNLVSDTVQQPVVDASNNVIPGSGFYIHAQSPTADPCLVSTLDDSDYTLGQGFMGSVPPWPGSGLTTRTFHKARVGDTIGPDLKLPDAPASTGPPPAIGIAVPVGTPAGTYYGKVQLCEQGRAVSNSMDVVVTCQESRITGGSTFSGDPHLAHLDVPGASMATGVSGTPTAFRNPLTGNVMFIWSSSRYPDETVGSSNPPTSSDPSYLYYSKLEMQTNAALANQFGEWKLSSANPTQWWSPTRPTSIFPSPVKVDDFFPSGPNVGAYGDLIRGSVKFGNPSAAVDKVNNKAYLLFTGQATKYRSDAGYSAASRNTQEFRTYYTEISGENINENQVYSTSPNSSGGQIEGDWSTPKFGARGGIMIRNAGDNPELWTFWYGGSSGKWRIYYNVKDRPSLPPSADPWTNEALLPIPKGLSSVAEPCPVFHVAGNATGNEFMVVYSGMSASRKNSDIYMSRYSSPSPAPKSVKQGNYKPVELVLMPQRADLIERLTPSGMEPEVIDPATGKALLGERLTRDPATSVWYSRDVDWLAGNETGVVSSANPRDFAVFVKLDPAAAPDTALQLNIGATDIDPSTGAIVYSYEGSSAAEANLRNLFRAVVINPTDGTVKFMRPPSGKALVAARYFPRAYRLTTDSVTDSNPCAVMDDDPNPRFSTNTTEGLPFYVPGMGVGGSATPPATDRLWVFWRRPGMDKSGTGIYYKAQRYMVQLGHQLGLNVKLVAGREVVSPAITEITLVDPPTYTPVNQAVEVDWVKNRLYFTGGDSRQYLNGKPYPAYVRIAYVDSKGEAKEEFRYIQYADEDINQSGKTFGNLTSLMVNEGQVNVFKDPGITVGGVRYPSNRLWVFWTSTRSGNSDIYYETISPRMVGREYK